MDSRCEPCIAPMKGRRAGIPVRRHLNEDPSAAPYLFAAVTGTSTRVVARTPVPN
jgi:hypothetical protein